MTLSTDSIAPLRLSDSLHSGTGSVDSASMSCSIEPLAEGVERLGPLVAEFVHVRHLQDEQGLTDVDELLDWLDGRDDLTDDQRYQVAMLRVERSIEWLALRRLLAHLRFQSLLTFNEHHISRIGLNKRLCVHLNPTHVWSRASHDEDSITEDELGGSVMFVAVGAKVRTIRVDHQTRQLMHRLAELGSASFTSLFRHVGRRHSGQLVETLQQLARAGVIAVTLA